MRHQAFLHDALKGFNSPKVQISCLKQAMFWSSQKGLP